LFHAVLAALSLKMGRLYSPQTGDCDDPDGFGLTHACVTGIGHSSSEAFAVLEAQAPA
jgi:hypothetical protein